MESTVSTAITPAPSRQDGIRSGYSGARG